MLLYFSGYGSFAKSAMFFDDANGSASTADFISEAGGIDAHKERMSFEHWWLTARISSRMHIERVLQAAMCNRQITFDKHRSVL